MKRSSLLASALGVSLFATILLIFTLREGVSQGLFQQYTTPEVYRALLADHAGFLKPDLFLDGLFIATYSLFFILLSQWIPRRNSNFLISRIGLALVLIAAFLDVTENFHIQAMLENSSRYDISSTEIYLQRILSQVKFFAAHFGVMLVGLAAHVKYSWFIKPLFVLQFIFGTAVFFCAGPLLIALTLFRGVFYIVAPILIALSIHETEPAALSD